MKRRKFLHTTGAAAASLLGLPFAGSAYAADDFPTKNLRIIVSASPGGSADKLARTIGQKLDARWGTRTIVENNPGGGGSIATNIVAKAKPDGYTLLLGGDSLSIEAIQQSKPLPYDPRKDITGVIKAVVNPLLIMVRPNLGVDNFQEYLAFLKANEGKTSLALSGAKNSHQHLAIELLSQLTGVKINVIPSLGGGPAMLDVIGGHIDAQIITLAAATENIRGGKLKGLAVTTPFRSKALPDIPTLQESGIKDYTFQSWQGLVAPAATPEPVIQKIYSEVASILQEPGNKTALEDLGFIVTASSPAELNQTIADDSKLYAEVARRAGLTL